MISEVARRYGKALFELAAQSPNKEKITSEIRTIKEVINSDIKISGFLSSPIFKPEEKLSVLQTALGNQVSTEVVQILGLLARKNRLSIFSDIIAAFEGITDESNGVSRGTVRSSKILSPEVRKNLEETVSRVTKKKVILNFKEDSQLLGGLVAQVSGWTFDDTLETHLTRMSEELNRRTN